MSNISSENIHVFPFGTTRNRDRLARVLNEQNITQLVKNMTDYPNYVLHYENNIMDFIIQGYYFSANISEVKESNKPLYAHIDISTDTSNYSFLTGGDVEEDNKYIFTGVTFTTSESEDKKNSLQLLDSDGLVPKESRVRMSADSLPSNISATLDIDVIYCGNSSILIEDINHK